MKHFIATILAFAYYMAVSGQPGAARQFLQTNSKSHLYYVDLRDGEGRVYAIGPYYDVAGTGHSITKTDTLQRQPDGSYSGRHFRISGEKDECYLVSTGKKTRKFRLDTVKDPNLVNNNLNNAYYLEQYYAMSSELYKTYPLNHHTFRDVFARWKALPNNEKEMDHLQFRGFADKRLKEIKDSSSVAQDKYVRLTNHIVQNIRSMDYTAFKDSLAQVPAEYAGTSRYYSTVIDTVALRQPEYFFRLAEDLPQHQSLIFMCGINNKQALAGLENVKGHDEVKKSFLKSLKSDRSAQVQAIGALALGAGLIIGIIIAL